MFPIPGSWASELLRFYSTTDFDQDIYLNLL